VLVVFVNALALVTNAHVLVVVARMNVVARVDVTAHARVVQVRK
jgi:hypothetical protein